MRLIHRYGFHQMSVSHPEGDTMHWCEWCGIRVVLKRDEIGGIKILIDPRMPRSQITMVNLKVPE